MNLTLDQLLNGVIYAGGLAAALTAIGVLLHFLIVRPVRAFIRKEIVGSLDKIETALKENTQITTDLNHRLEDHITSGHRNG